MYSKQATAEHILKHCSIFFFASTLWEYGGRIYHSEIGVSLKLSDQSFFYFKKCYVMDGVRMVGWPTT